MSLDTVTTKEESRRQYFHQFFQTTSEKFIQVANIDAGLFDLPAMKSPTQGTVLIDSIGERVVALFATTRCKIISEIKE